MTKQKIGDVERGRTIIGVRSKGLPMRRSYAVSVHLSVDERVFALRVLLSSCLLLFTCHSPLY